MNPDSFSVIGYLGMLLWLSVPLLWWLSRRSGASPWLCPAAVGLAVLSLVFAKINSRFHVDRIAPDQTSEIEKRKAMEEANRKAIEASRSEDVADIRFAEDGADDFLDVAGMDESDLKYMKSLGAESEPEWKKEKKNRGAESTGDDSLESRLGGKGAIEGVMSDDFQAKDETKPILMSEAHMAMAHRLDAANQTVAWWVIGLALLVLLRDYLARSAVYSLAYSPLPLPSTWRNLVKQPATVVDRFRMPRRPMVAELEWIARQGDSFLLLTTDTSLASAVPASLPRFRCGMIRPMEVIHASQARISDDFVFEGLWYGTSSFVVDSPEQAGILFDHFLTRLEERKMARTHVKQTAHVVWDLDTPPSPSQRQRFERAAASTGFSLLLCR